MNPFTMIRGNRLSDLSKVERQKFYQFLEKHKQDKNLISKIRDKFGLDYSLTSIKYILILANRKDHIKSLKIDNKIMEKWKVPDNPADSPNYADYLDDLATHKIGNKEFCINTQSIKF